MRMVFWLIAAVVFAALGPVGATDKTESVKSRASLKAIHWLIGTWKSAQASGDSYEFWKQSGEDKLTGGGYALAGKDTTFSEKLSLVATDSGLFYVADVAHNAAPVYFRMTSQDSLVTVFENPAHDFPTRIIYRHLTADSLHARIEGIRKGKPAGVDFVFQRLK